MNFCIFMNFSRIFIIFSKFILDLFGILKLKFFFIPGADLAIDVHVCVCTCVSMYARVCACGRTYV